jgi:hypothetical protein
MKAIFHRLRRLENTAAPAAREQANAEMILENMRRSGTDYKRPGYPPDWFVRCRGTADHMCAPVHQV